MHFIRCFIVFTESALPVLKALLLDSCQLHVSILKGSLILSTSSVSRRDLIMQALREVVHLNMELCHTIHESYSLGVWSLCPDTLRLFSLSVNDITLLVPIAFNSVRYIFLFTFLNIGFPLKFE